MAILHHFYTNEMLHFRKVFEMGHIAPFWGPKWAKMAPPFPKEQALRPKRSLRSLLEALEELLRRWLTEGFSHSAVLHTHTHTHTQSNIPSLSYWLFVAS